MHAILANHYLFGAFYPRGGASEIAFHIIPVIEKAGGKVLVRARVSKILVEEASGKVQGRMFEETQSFCCCFFLYITLRLFCLRASVSASRHFFIRLLLKIIKNNAGKPAIVQKGSQVLQNKRMMSKRWGIIP